MNSISFIISRITPGDGFIGKIVFFKPDIKITMGVDSNLECLCPPKQSAQEMFSYLFCKEGFSCEKI